MCKIVPDVLLVQKWCRAQEVYIGRHPPRRSFAELKICTTDIPTLAMFIPTLSFLASLSEATTMHIISTFWKVFLEA